MGMGSQLFSSASGRPSMNIFIASDVWRAVSNHLLPMPARREEAAFLFGRYESHEGKIDVTGYQLLHHEDFASHEIDHLELCDASRSEIIKRAHATQTCLIEIHSHPGHLPAAFSKYDIAGLREMVTHMHWRLRKQPYTALVIANDSVDALMWENGSHHPRAVTTIEIGDQTLLPTQISIRNWR